MLRISQLKRRPDEGTEELCQQVRRILRLGERDTFTIQIRRKSIDARKKPDIFYVYTVDVSLKDPETERRILLKNRNHSVTAASDRKYRIPAPGRVMQDGASSGREAADREEERQSGLRPVIIGAGPAGLFCGLALARAGLRPILIERGESVEKRTRTVSRFWQDGILDPESNVQFGEGGAGTFSDGKLNTGIKDPYGRIRFVLETFAAAGADPEILYSYRPHIGTDVLKKAVSHIRDEILSRGGEVRCGEKLCSVADVSDSACGDDVQRQEKFRSYPETFRKRTVWRLETEKGGKVTSLDAETVVLAIGHSARDTFAMLKETGFAMSAKPFAVGIRIQHPQGMIDDALYGKDCPYDMPPASYKLTRRLGGGKGVYSFCMCPGGYVVNASSETGKLAVNGMSFHDRGSGCANSAVVVTVTPEDIRRYRKDKGRAESASSPDCSGDQQAAGMEDVLSGIEFQRQLERAAYEAGRGSIPVQTFGSFRLSGKACPGTGREMMSPGRISSFRPCFKGRFRSADVRGLLPKEIGDAIEEGILSWDRQIPGFADPSALLAGVESRTSSPVRIHRGEDLQAEGMPGIYPCGEGAGYAGGITSAAVDGLRVAEAILACCG